jgi:antitoxin component YwqK of YwqJK toxin-antitoxin module
VAGISHSVLGMRTVSEEVELKDGQAEGLSRAYFPSGSLKSQVTLRNGKVVDQQFYKDGE